VRIKRPARFHGTLDLTGDAVDDFQIGAGDLDADRTLDAGRERLRMGGMCEEQALCRLLNAIGSESCAR
jgi:hypothetical protein